MRFLTSSASLSFLLILILGSAAPHSTEAPTGFDNKSNGLTDDVTHQADQTKFEEVEQLTDGIGPLYNAQSCRECHQSPVSGAASQVTELRVGHPGPDGHFRTPDIPIAHGAEVISGRSLVNDRAICPNGAFPDKEIQERVPETETIRTLRLSLQLCCSLVGYRAPALSWLEQTGRSDQCQRGRPILARHSVRTPCCKSWLPHPVVDGL